LQWNKQEVDVVDDVSAKRRPKDPSVEERDEDLARVLVKDAKVQRNIK
jgi:hypothetical protein